jgi:hypothetical protein
MDYYKKYVKYKKKYLKLKKKLITNTIIQEGGNLIPIYMLGGYFDVPKIVFSNDINNSDIYSWHDKTKTLHAFKNTYIFLSSSQLCQFNYYKNKFNMSYCSQNALNLYNLLKNINNNYYLICINYLNNDPNSYYDTDFQIGITETQNYGETHNECARRGIIEEIGLNFNVNDLEKSKLNNTYVNNMICYMFKLSDFEHEAINSKSNLKLNGGNTNIFQQKRLTKFENKKIKTNVFMYDTLKNIIKYLSLRYTDELNNIHYIINNNISITNVKLKNTNIEKKNINICVISLYDVKNMLMLIHNRQFNK